MIKFVLNISMIAIVGVLIISTLSCTKTDVVKPIDIDTTKSSAFKVSATITGSSSNFGLGGLELATINIKNDSLFPINVSLIASLSNYQLIDTIFLTSLFFLLYY